MKLVFLSNYMNHHQYFLCNEWDNNQNIEFKFIATENVPDFRKNIGYKDYDSKFILQLTSENQKFVKVLLYDADVVLVGGISDSLKCELLGSRLRDDKIVVYYEERYFKGEFKSFIKNFAKFILKRQYFKKFKENHNQYLFAASSKMKDDCKILGFFKNNIYAWGYFPKYEYSLSYQKNKSMKLNILWVGRYIGWKHPEIMIKLAEKLKKQMVDFHITMIGDGPLLNKISNTIVKKKLTNEVTILFGLSNNQVLLKMQESDIFISTSDSNEGWGVVINEAMSSNCLVISNEKIGSTEFLLKNNYTGLTYKNFENLVSIINKIYNNEIDTATLLCNAKKHINKFWNYKYAASVSYNLFDSFINGNCNIQNNINSEFIYPGDKL